MKKLLLFSALALLNTNSLASPSHSLPVWARHHSNGQNIADFQFSKLNVLVASHYSEHVGTPATTTTTDEDGAAPPDEPLEDGTNGVDNSVDNDGQPRTERPLVTYCNGWIAGPNRVVVPGRCVLSPDIIYISVYYDTINELHIYVSKIASRQGHEAEMDLLFLELEAQFPRQIQKQWKLAKRNFEMAAPPKHKTFVSIAGYVAGKPDNGMGSSSVLDFLTVVDKGTIGLTAPCASIPGFKHDLHDCIRMNHKAGTAMTGALVYGNTKAKAPPQLLGSTVAETLDGDFKVLARLMHYVSTEWPTGVVKYFRSASHAWV